MSTICDLLSRFGFVCTSFTQEFSSTDRFRHESHETTLKHLRCVIEECMSAALIAPAGYGKTTLFRAFHFDLSSSRYRCSYLKATDLSKHDFCRELSQAFGLQLSGNYPNLLRRLQEHLETGYMEQHRWLIILDEAHDFRPEVLEILRILTDFQMDSRLSPC